MSYHGDIRLEETIDIGFSTVDSTGLPTTLAGTPTVAAYPGNSLTEITAGITLTVDFDARTGLHNVRVVATAANGYAAATNYKLVITAGTVGGVSVVGYVVGSFSIEHRLLGAGAINAAAIAADAITAAKIASAAITAAKFGAGAIDAAAIGADAITAAKIAAGAIDAATFAAGAIDAAAIAASAITNTKLATGAITAAKFAAGAIDAAAIASDAIAAAKIADGALTALKFQACMVRGTVGTSATTTSIPTSSLDPAVTVADQLKGRIICFDRATTTAALRGQVTDISANTSGGTLTCTALTTSPVSGDTFVIL